MNILYLPLDERPCNCFYPQMIARLQPQVQLIVPPQERLGHKKRPADIAQLWDWLDEKILTCQVAILSIEMLVYGGLLPSRLHHHSVEQLGDRLHRLRGLKQRHPKLILLASNLIMRTPTYDSSEEEPDYYETFGQQIFQWGWLTDKANRDGLNDTEQTQLAQIQQTCPAEYLADYRTRRTSNLAINLAAIALVKAGQIDFLAIPQDDSAPYGFTALDQAQISAAITEQRLQHHVHVYPGADEVGCTLLARAYSLLTAKRCKFYCLFSSVNSEQMIPLYEDRPLGESLQSHLLATRAQRVKTPQEADVILAINTAGQVMQEAWEQPSKDPSYSTHRNLRCFVDQIVEYSTAGHPVAIADVAFANGGETELIELLEEGALWDKMLAYAGWNTSCNSIGTVIATAMLGSKTSPAQTMTLNKMHHLLEDWAYQSIVRQDMVQHYLPRINASYYDFNGQETQINQEMNRRLLALWQRTFQHSFSQWQLTQLETFSPWHRMFEIGLNLTIAPKKER